jgi:hypothetical protein
MLANDRECNDDCGRGRSVVSREDGVMFWDPFASAAADDGQTCRVLA